MLVFLREGTALPVFLPAVGYEIGPVVKEGGGVFRCGVELNRLLKNGFVAVRKGKGVEAIAEGAVQDEMGGQSYSRPLAKSRRSTGVRYGGFVDRREERLDSLPHGIDSLKPFVPALVAADKPVTVSLTGEIEEIQHNERFFAHLGLSGRFRGLWPSLGDLKKWISVHWEPIVEDCVQIYPHAQGFFVVVFQNETDRNKVLRCCQWCWEDKHPLMLKPWHPTFNLDLETFDCTPLGIRLPNLPMQFWRRVKRPASWWKEVTPNFYTVDKVEENRIPSQDPQVLSGENLGSKGKMPETKGNAGTTMQRKTGVLGGGGNVSVNAINCGDQAASEHKQELKAKSGSNMGFTGVYGANHISSQISEEGGKEILRASSLKLLENARDEGWIEVKRR
ncbi:hypothetical protein SUGI_0183130 [Cryptomeria japonica]|nr:hypothetical protein SUGI_0183130 [Cryptomeria japonica]